ncbi:MAG: iron-containing alcohol dehydrogenase [Candidatus Hodarchaeota archaeon]
MTVRMIKLPIIYYGKGSLKELKNLSQNKVLVVTDKVINEIHGNLISKFLSKKDFIFFDEIEPDPMDITISKGGEVAREYKPDLIIGFGGGSVMDAAKGIYFLYECEDKKLHECILGTVPKLGQKSKLILIPTTSGTGAESTGGAGVTDSETNRKGAIASIELVPEMIIIDPKLPLKMPPKLTASTGLDALTHAIEGIYSNIASDFTDALNLHAIKLIINYLPLAVGEGANDINIRAKVHYAASIAGLALGHSVCAIAHACGHSIGAVYHIPHGISVSIMLPYIIEFNKPTSEKKYENILNNINVLINDDATKTLANFVRDFLKKVNVPITIKDFGISKKEWERNIEKLVSFADADFTKIINPRSPSEEDFRKIFEYAYEGRPIDF